MSVDKEYIWWLGEIKARYCSAQAKAAVRMNAEQLQFNWELGRDLVVKKAEKRWGAGVAEQVSLDLQAAFPESKGFSPSNLWRMKQWYLFYSDAAEKLAQVGRELQITDYEWNIKLAQLGLEVRSPQFEVEMDSESIGMPFPTYFARVPWKHHVEIDF